VARMQQVEAAARKYDALPVAFPFAPMENQLVLRNYNSQFRIPRPAIAYISKHSILPCAQHPLRSTR
jgi:hypothetical protein